MCFPPDADWIHKRAISLGSVVGRTLRWPGRGRRGGERRENDKVRGQVCLWTDRQTEERTDGPISSHCFKGVVFGCAAAAVSE